LTGGVEPYHTTRITGHWMSIVQLLLCVTNVYEGLSW